MSFMPCNLSSWGVCTAAVSRNHEVGVCFSQCPLIRINIRTLWVSYMECSVVMEQYRSYQAAKMSVTESVWRGLKIISLKSRSTGWGLNPEISECEVLVLAMNALCFIKRAEATNLTHPQLVPFWSVISHKDSSEPVMQCYICA